MNFNKSELKQAKKDFMKLISTDAPVFRVFTQERFDNYLRFLKRKRGELT